MSKLDNKDFDSIDEMTRIATNFLELNNWGFTESYRSPKPGKLIYNSDSCRISLIWGGWDYLAGNSMNIYYGRLHAPNDKTTMIWRGEECHCWQRYEYALHFLDGRTPAEAVKLNLSHPLKDPFYAEELLKKFDGRQPEWLAHMHAAVWQHYGSRFFQLFDLRYPDLWEQYKQFLKDFYDIKGRKPNANPPPDKIC